MQRRKAQRSGLELGPAEGAAFDPSVWTPSGDWQRRDKAWVSVGDPRASLRWSGQATEGLRLKLLRSRRASGVTLVRSGDHRAAHRIRRKRIGAARD